MGQLARQRLRIPKEPLVTGTITDEIKRHQGRLGVVPDPGLYLTNLQANSCIGASLHPCMGFPPSCALVPAHRFSPAIPATALNIECDGYSVFGCIDDYSFHIK